jgi:hypothetical protein
MMIHDRKAGMPTLLEGRDQAREEGSVITHPKTTIAAQDTMIQLEFVVRQWINGKLLQNTLRLLICQVTGFDRGEQRRLNCGDCKNLGAERGFARETIYCSIVDTLLVLDSVLEPYHLC